MKRLLLLLLLLFVTGLFMPYDAIIPVKNAKCNDWNAKTFWFEPWGTSGVHKGIDVFAKEGTPLLAATSGWVTYSGDISKGGKVIAILGPKWRIHYYAHLKDISPTLGRWVSQGDEIGSVGRTGNAINKPAHLHYSVLTLAPYPWRATTETQGWKKMFYLDPASAFGVCG
ncbi:M23 family metallopeptidase [Enterovibrio norvegicus]|uniref:M23 family metallopeptidase n=1 Tax=Enterovibrio norvegicus TaxID=188144 RepID=UPI00352E1991